MAEINEKVNPAEVMEEITVHAATGPKNVIEIIDYNDIVEVAIAMKHSGYRLSQACAAYVGDELNLYYTYVDDDNNDCITVNAKLEDRDTVIMSITNVFPYAAFYENEMHELFGANINLTVPDYKDRLYRIEQETPMAPPRKDPEEQK
ncbi:NADH-quinone oxidoreductase subunit C [Lachnospiraceae bacterium C1.1]|nr:NADH-quinone oxidoreductase subunit C [Lachnospiraceae bacterium C1.1]